MKKSNVLWIMLDLMFLIIFNVVFFVLGGTKHVVSVWISYGFIHIAYFILLLTPTLIRSGKSAALFGFSLYSISTTYFIVEFITGITFILASPESYKVTFLTQFCIAAIHGIILLTNMITNEKTASAEEEQQYQIDYVKTASAKLKSMLEKIDDKEIKKKIERVYDAFYSSPVKSHSDVIQMENDILRSIDKLVEAVSVGSKEHIISLSDSLLNAVNTRNQKLK